MPLAAPLPHHAAESIPASGDAELELFRNTTTDQHVPISFQVRQGEASFTFVFHSCLLFTAVLHATRFQRYKTLGCLFVAVVLHTAEDVLQITSVLLHECIRVFL